MNDELNEFMTEIKKARYKRNSKLNSYDLKDFYRDYIKGLDRNSEYFIGEKQYGDIIRATNKLIQERLLDGCQVVFPYSLGSLQLECRKNKVSIKDGKLVSSYSVDWIGTMKLWYEDSQCRKEKRLVRNMNDFRYMLKYRRGKGYLKNKQYLNFLTCRPLKKIIKNKLENEGLDVLQII